MFDPSRVQRGMRRVAERRIEAAQQAGAFANLRGAGEPLADRGEARDEQWWVRQWVNREGLSAGQLRRDAANARRDASKTGPKAG